MLGWCHLSHLEVSKLETETRLWSVKKWWSGHITELPYMRIKWMEERKKLNTEITWQLGFWRKESTWFCTQHLMKIQIPFFFLFYDLVHHWVLWISKQCWVSSCFHVLCGWNSTHFPHAVALYERSKCWSLFTNSRIAVDSSMNI